MIFYGKVEYGGVEHLFEGNDIDEGSGGSAIGRLFFQNAWQQWQISGRPMPDVRELTAQDKEKWLPLMRGEINFFKSPFGR